MSTERGLRSGFLWKGALACVLLPCAAQAGQIEILQARFGDVAVNSQTSVCDATASVRAVCGGRISCSVQASQTLCRGGSASSSVAKLTINYACTPGGSSDVEIASLGNSARLECAQAVESVPVGPAGVSDVPNSIDRGVALRSRRAPSSSVMEERRPLLVQSVPTRQITRVPPQRTGAPHIAVANAPHIAAAKAPQLPAPKPVTRPRAAK